MATALVFRHARFQPTDHVLELFRRYCTAPDGKQWAMVAWIPHRQCLCVLELRKRRGGDQWVIRYEVRDDYGHPRQADMRDIHSLMRARNNLLNHGNKALDKVEETERKAQEEAEAMHFDYIRNDLPSQMRNVKAKKFDMGGSSVNGGCDSRKQGFCHHGNVYQDCPACNGEAAPMRFHMGLPSGDGRNGKFVLNDKRRV